MPERERSRSPSPAKDGDSAPAENAAPAEDVKLYVGNLDYGTLVSN